MMATPSPTGKEESASGSIRKMRRSAAKVKRSVKKFEAKLKDHVNERARLDELAAVR